MTTTRRDVYKRQADNRAVVLAVNLFGYLPDKLIPTTKTYEDLLDVIEQKNLDLSLLRAGDTLDLGSGAVLSVLGPVTEEIDRCV